MLFNPYDSFNEIFQQCLSTVSLQKINYICLYITAGDIRFKGICYKKADGGSRKTG